MTSISRRRVVQRMVTASTALIGPFRLAAQSGNAKASRKAEISEFDLSLLGECTTPNDLFFVREHFPAPAIAAETWKLEFSGAIASPFAISYEELLQQPRQNLPATLECAENPAGGGLVSHAEWVGVSLGKLLEKARPSDGARFVRLHGFDSDPGGDASYFRSLPLEKAMHPLTLLAHRMNGARLPPEHGFPLRAIIPGWYGMDWVKWLRLVEVSTEAGASPAKGGAGYTRKVRDFFSGSRTGRPVREVYVKSVFTRPMDGAILRGRRFVVRGAAWAGENRVQEVEISTDGGGTWQAARLSARDCAGPRPYAWILWEYDWKIAGPGKYSLAVRAKDDKGRLQPAERPSERLDPYEWDAWQRIGVTVT
jgi:DMSO/TMAO reductase YedYZ molybdopterin-dependent catalytic subunit